MMNKSVPIIFGMIISAMVLLFMATLVVPAEEPPTSPPLDKITIHMQTQMSDVVLRQRERLPPPPERLPEILPELSAMPTPSIMTSVLPITPALKLTFTPSAMQITAPNVVNNTSNINNLTHISNSPDSQTLGNTLLTPLHRIEPIYPQRAQQAKIEGFVTVSFNVNSKGEVEDVTIIEAKPRRYFERAAIDAVKKWRYQPQITGDANRQTKRQQTVTLEFKF